MGQTNHEKAVEVVAKHLHQIVHPGAVGTPGAGFVFRARQIVSVLDKEGLLK